MVVMRLSYSEEDDDLMEEGVDGALRARAASLIVRFMIRKNTMMIGAVR